MYFTTCLWLTQGFLPDLYVKCLCVCRWDIWGCCLRDVPLRGFNAEQLPSLPHTVNRCLSDDSPINIQSGTITETDTLAFQFLIVFVHGETNNYTRNIMYKGLYVFTSTGNFYDLKCYLKKSTHCLQVCHNRSVNSLYRVVNLYKMCSNYVFFVSSHIQWTCFEL